MTGEEMEAVRNALLWTEYQAFRHAGAARAMAQVARAIIEGCRPEELWQAEAEKDAEEARQ